LIGPVSLGLAGPAPDDLCLRTDTRVDDHCRRDSARHHPTARSMSRQNKVHSGLLRRRHFHQYEFP
jgi:hypothetical protein